MRRGQFTHKQKRFQLSFELSCTTVFMVTVLFYSEFCTMRHFVS